MTTPYIGSGPVGADLWSDAPIINGGVWSQPTPNATLTDDIWATDGFAKTAWWKFVAPADGWVQFEGWYETATGLDDGYCYVFTGADIDSFVPADKVGASYTVTAGQVLYLAIGSWDGANTVAGTYYLQVGNTEDHPEYVSPPLMIGADNFSDAGTMLANARGGATTATAFSKEPGEPALNTASNRSAWWHWTAPRDGWASIARDTNRHTFAVFTGDDLGSLQLIGFTGPNYYPLEVRWLAQAGVDYKIMMTDYDLKTSSVYYPTLKLRPLLITEAPATSVVLSAGWTGTVVGGAAALSTPDLSSYVSGVGASGSSGSYFQLNFAPIEIPPAVQLAGLGFKVIASGPGSYDLATALLPFTKQLSFYASSWQGFGRQWGVGPLAETPSEGRSGIPLGYYDFDYSQITAGGNPIDMTYTAQKAFTVYYAAWEVFSWGEAVEQALLPEIITGPSETRRRFT